MNAFLWLATVWTAAAVAMVALYGRHHRRRQHPLDTALHGDDRPGAPSADLTRCHAIWPDPPTWPRKEDQP